MCDHKEMHIGKVVGDFVGFNGRINQHISDCRTAFPYVNFPHTYITVP